MAGLMWLLGQMRSGSQIRITLVGLTNNSAGLLGTTDKTLAVFSVTNGSSASIQDHGFYYIEQSNTCWIYSPLGSGGRIPPHGSGTIFTRIPTNAFHWRVAVPYSSTGSITHFANNLQDTLDRALKRPDFEFERYRKNAPKSDWVER